MKVVCIDNTSGNARHLELYGIYDTKEPDDDFRNSTLYSLYYILYIDPYIIEANLHRRLGEFREVWIDKKSFVSLGEFRQAKIIDLGI